MFVSDCKGVRVAVERGDFVFLAIGIDNIVNLRVIAYSKTSEANVKQSEAQHMHKLACQREANVCRHL